MNEEDDDDDEIGKDLETEESEFEDVGSMLQTLKNSGVDLSEPRLIEHTFYCQDAEAVDKLAEHMKSLGYEVDDAVSNLAFKADMKPGEFMLVVSENACPDQMEMKEDQFDEIADQFLATYDGWGTAI